MRDGIDPSEGALLDRLGRACVRDRAALQRVRGVHCHPQFVDGVGGEVWNAAARPAARGDDLDGVGPLGDQDPDLATDLVEGIGDAPAPVEVTAAVRDGAPGEVEPRPCRSIPAGSLPGPKTWSGRAPRSHERS